MNVSFAHVEYPKHHGGVERVQRVLLAAQTASKGWSTTRSLAAVLLAAMVSALVVVADQIIDTWADGHLLTAWVALWAIGFAALALFAPAAKRAAVAFVVRLDAWSCAVARRRADNRLWDLARKDDRVMADLRAALTRAEAI